MLDFLKRIFRNRYTDLTFVLFDDEEPESSTSYRFKPVNLWYFGYAIIAGTAVLTFLLVMFTPLNNLVYNSEDAKLRQQVIAITQKVEALQDSLHARDVHLSEMQEVLASDSDTLFTTDELLDREPVQQQGLSREPFFLSDVQTERMISENEILFSGIFKNAPEFPTFYPVEGTFTRGYNPETGHYGIDIATKKDTPFKAIADGAVINQDWTINYGYVLHVQHSNGIVVIYKHATSLSKTIGDIVLKGDVLGTAGDTGVLSTGPHLHLEIWKNGVPQNPNSYLIKS